MVKRIKKDSSGVGSLKVDDKLISNSKDKANVLNDQFKSVFNKKVSPTIYLIWDPVPLDQCKTFSSLCLGQLKIHKSAGPGGIVPTKIIVRIFRTTRSSTHIYFQ